MTPRQDEFRQDDGERRFAVRSIFMVLRRTVIHYGDPQMVTSLTLRMLHHGFFPFRKIDFMFREIMFQCLFISVFEI